MRWLTYDPAADLDSPEQRAVTATAADDIWTPEQMAKLLDHVTTHRLGGCFALTLLGLRREEVGGLRWSDIDLDTGALHIRRARVDVNGRDTIVPTKTERSARGLPVPPRELAMLKAMRSVHLRERLAVGRPLTAADLLLSRVDGSRLICRDGLSSGHAELALISLQGRIFPVPRWLLFVDVARRAEVKAGAARPHPEGAWP
jgi:integrase